MSENKYTEAKPEATETIQFITLKEAKPEIRAEQTEAELNAWLMQQLVADKKTLNLLATL